MTDDWQDFRAWMRRPDVRAAVARRSARAEEEEEEPQLEPRQLVMEGI